GREVLRKPDVCDVIGFGREDLLRAAARIHAQRQVDQSRNDGRVADRLEIELFGVAGSHDPDHGLATMQAVFLGLPGVGEGGQLAAKVDEVLVALRPVAEEGEFVADRALCFAGAGFEGEGRGIHGAILPRVIARLLCAITTKGQAPCACTGHPRFQRTPWAVSSSTTPSPASWSRMASARAKSRDFFAALRSSISIWMRASSSPDVPRANHAAGSCCSRPSASPAPSSSDFRRCRSPADSVLRASPAIRAISASTD